MSPIRGIWGGAPQSPPLAQSPHLGDFRVPAKSPLSGLGVPPRGTVRGTLKSPKWGLCGGTLGDCGPPPSPPMAQSPHLGDFGVPQSPHLGDFGSPQSSHLGDFRVPPQSPPWGTLGWGPKSPQSGDFAGDLSPPLILGLYLAVVERPCCRRTTKPLSSSHTGWPKAP